MPLMTKVVTQAATDAFLAREPRETTRPQQVFGGIFDWFCPTQLGNQFCSFRFRHAKRKKGERALEVFFFGFFLPDQAGFRHVGDIAVIEHGLPSLHGIET